MDMAGMLIKSLGIDPAEMKKKGQEIYEYIAGKIESVDDRLADIHAQNLLIMAKLGIEIPAPALPEAIGSEIGGGPNPDFVAEAAE
jgi:hypothetical protein